MMNHAQTLGIAGTRQSLDKTRDEEEVGRRHESQGSAMIIDLDSIVNLDNNDDE